LHTVGS